MLLYNILWNVFIYFPRRRNFAYDGPVRALFVPQTLRVQWAAKKSVAGGRVRRARAQTTSALAEFSWEAAEKIPAAAVLPVKRAAGPCRGICRPSAQHPSYAMRELGFAGWCGACSTAGRGACWALFVRGRCCAQLPGLASSHFAARQKASVPRTPLLRCYAHALQWMDRCRMLLCAGRKAGISVPHLRRVQDYRVKKDINNMGLPWPGSSFHPAYFKDTGTPNRRSSTASIPATLGGWAVSCCGEELLAAEGLPIQTGGLRVHPVRCKRAERKERRGSGLGCAAVLCGHILPRLRRGSQKRVLFTATGGPDEPDHLFAEGDHPGGGASGGAACAGKGEASDELFLGFLWAGLACVAGQLLIDLTGPARIPTGYVVAGVVLSAIGWYAPLAEFAGCGATVPQALRPSVGSGRAHRAGEEGAVGILTGGLTAAAAGVTAPACVRAWCAAGGQVTTRTEEEIH